MRICPQSILLLLLFSLTCPGFSEDNTPNRLVQGQMDLRSRPLERSVIRLDGEWEFYWNRLLVPDDFAENPALKPDLYGWVPRVWNKYQLEGRTLSGKGFATYRAVILLPENNPHIYGIKVPVMHTSYRLWINGQPVLSNGMVGTNPQSYYPQFITGIAAAGAPSNRIEIVMQIANYVHRVGGFRYPMFFGRYDNIIQKRIRAISLDVLLISILGFMAIYYLGFFFTRKTDRTTLYFGLTCLVFAIRTFITNEVLLTSYLPGFDWHLHYKVEFLTFFLLLHFFSTFVYTLYQKYLSRAVIRSIQGISLLGGLVVLLTPSTVYTQLWPVFQVVIVLGLLYLVAGSIRPVIQKEIGARIILTGYIIIFLTTLGDILYSNNLITVGFVGTHGLIVFIFLQSFVLSMRFSRTFQMVEDLSANLEKKVELRTRELNEERNQLKIRNEIIEQDLALARKIQKQYLLNESPRPDIAFFYQPMDKVGGDFFDIIQFRNMNQIGIFISDVSGHGVPAAFVTSMIKSALQQSASILNKTDLLMKKMNQTLFNHTGGNFVTAFYCIYNTVTRELRFTNAGHNPPFIISPGRTQILSTSQGGYPLAILNNQELRENQKEYREEKIVLPAETRLFLYTDGLVETIRISDSVLDESGWRDFEQSGLLKTLDENHQQNCTVFIEKVKQELYEFRGGDYFDDDICMICLET